jgi:hypothetical protein
MSNIETVREALKLINLYSEPGGLAEEKSTEALIALGIVEAERDTLRGRLAEIDASPTIGVVIKKHSELEIARVCKCTDIPPRRTQLIVRPEAK